MPLTIHLDNHKPCYFGDETICGRVIFESSSITSLRDIRVTFTGRSKARIRKVKGSGAPAANYRSNCILFEKEKILVQLNGEALPPGRHEWLFQFTFPTAARSSVKWPEKHPFRSDANQPLPPAFAIEAGDKARTVSCAIEYRIDAKAVKPQRGLFPSTRPLFSDEVRLSFMPDFAVADSCESDCAAEIYQQQKEQVFSIRSMLLVPENKGRSLSTGEKIQGWFAPGQLPRFSFTASFSYPTRVVHYTPVQCSLDIKPHMEDSSVTSPPEIIMKSISITAISQTAARAAPSVMGAISADLENKMEILSRTSLHMPVSGKVDLGMAFGPLVLRHTDVSFQTFNICRGYCFCVSIVLVCAGKTNEFKLTNLPFEVIAKLETSEKKNIAFELAEAIEDAPPAYTHSARLSSKSFDEV
ncbi:hypothetical protein BDW72DRAFT_209657 [Aspergillus terricola var. indicus]